jgi:Fe-S cluster biogenesis protein NfuA
MSNKPDDVQIAGEPTMDPQVCRFIVNQQIIPGGSLNCADKAKAEGSPLLEALMSIEGVAQVNVAGAVITVAKSGHDTWPEIGQKIGIAIRDQVAGGGTLIDMDKIAKAPDEATIRSMIEKLFTEEINPQISSHGGSVELVDVKGTQVFVRLGGGCQGCASANQTLKMGIERAILEIVPEISEVIDATDHTSGDSPYM